VKLARCNKTLQRRVYQECSQAHVTIDFSNMDSALYERLMDQDLSIFLTRVNSKQITTFLNIASCKAIRGPGLEPLRNSQVLEGLNLNKTGFDDNPTPFLWILRTMMGYRLFDVRLCEEFRPASNERAVVDFMRNLRAVKAAQAREQQIQCKCCQEPAFDASRQVIPVFTGFPLMRCCNCDDHFCRRGTCPMDIWDCNDCLSTYCGECDNAGQCYFCG